MRLAAAASAQTVVLDLRNGDRLSGVIVLESTNGVVLSNAWSRELVLPAAQIVRRTVLAAPVVPLAAPTNLTTKLALAGTNSPALAKPPKHWAGEAELGLDMARSTKTRQIFHGAAKATYVKAGFRNISEVSGAYGRNDGMTDTDRVDAANKTDYDVRNQWYIYNRAGVGYDHVRKVDLGYEDGPGVGYHLVKRPTFVLNTEAGFDYRAELRAEDEDISRFYGRLGENSSWKINHRFSLDHRVEYLPSVESPSQFRLRGEANLRYWVLQNLSFNVTVLDSYDTAPARDVTPNDLQIRSSVGVKF